MECDRLGQHKEAGLENAVNRDYSHELLDKI